MFDFFSHHTLLQGDYSLNDIKIQEELGRGNSHVFTAIIKDQIYALKQIQIKNDYEYQDFLKQVTFMKQLSNQSQCMVKYQGYFITKMQVNQYLKHKYAFIIMECAQMSLQNLIIEYKLKKQRFKITEIEIFIQYILNALCSLQEKNIAHCDIKPQNILIMNSTTFNLKLCDVGSCKIVTGQNRQQATILGTVPFLAPQLIKIKSTKIISSNPFKSDVFSFGLVFLYLITFKKFKSLERLQTQQAAYKEIIFQWIRQAKQLVNFDTSLSELFRLTLEFNQFKRPLFKQLKTIYFAQKRKKYEIREKQIEELEKLEEDKLFSNKVQLSSTYFQSVPSNQISLFKSRKFEKPTIKTSSNGSTFRITTTSNTNPFKMIKQRNYSPSPLTKRKNSFQSQLNSPQKLSNNWSFLEIKKVVFINQKSKQLMPTQIVDEFQKIFVLQIPFVPFKKAETVTILSTCELEVFYKLQGVQTKRLYLQYQGFDGIGLANDAPILKLAKIRINLIKSSFVGGYQGLFRIIANSQLQILQLRLTESEVQFKEVIFLLDSLINQCPKLTTLVFCWQKNILTQDEHFLLTQKISKLGLKKLMMIMNQNYIKYDKQMTWILPKSCEVLYLDYGHNLLNSIINNLSLTIGASQNLKQLYFNFQNNNLLKGEMNMVVKAISQLKKLEKLILDMSYNKIQDLNYLQKNISELVNLTVIQIRLHKTQTSIERTIQFIKSLLQLFQWKLTILKVTINRIINLSILQEKINQQCTTSKRISSQVIGFDNNYFMIYIKRKNKPTARTNKGAATSVKKDLKSLSNFGLTTINSNTITLSTTATSNFRTKNTIASKNINGVCTRFYTMSQGFDNYMCLGCCQNKQSAKNTFYCKFCIQHCLHKGHNIVKVYSRTKCCCSHSGYCTSQISQNECAQVLGIDYKRQYDCLKCNLSFCISCINSCKQLHSSWVRQSKQMNYFKCSKINKQ